MAEPRIIKPKSKSGYAVYFGDFDRKVYALDANSGEMLWSTQIETQPRQLITGAPVIYDGVIYVPTSSFEEMSASVDAYECCKSRGSLSAIDTETGKVLWKSYAIKTEPKPYKKNSAGTQLYGPAGAAIWSAPTIDPKRGFIYVATGDSYTEVPEENATDSLIAFDLKTGTMRWKTQVTANDNYNVGCLARTVPLNCPQPSGPDWDFGSSPVLKSIGEKDILLAGQKSGVVYGFDPDTGKILWRTTVGAGSTVGGIEWGIGADENAVFAPVADTNTNGDVVPNGNPGLTALSIQTGTILWHVAADPPKCSWTSNQGKCKGGYSAPPSVIPGVVFSGGQDGHLRAFDTKSGQKVWDFDTAAQTYDTVNGVKAQRGGQLDGTGPTIAGGRLYMISGYNGSAGGGWSNNVLLTLSIGSR